MKTGIFICLVLLYTGSLSAQTEAEEELSYEQKWLLDKTKKFFSTAGTNISKETFFKNFKNLLASNELCQPSFKPAINIHLEGKRLDERSTFLKWDVTAEKTNGQYIVERRYLNPHGAFDSIGVIVIPETPSAFQSYRFQDLNDFPGVTWYRLRRIGGLSKEEKLINVKGYNNSLKVLPNPSRSSDIYIELTKFKTDDNTTLVITDSRGTLVHSVAKAFNGTTVYPLRHLRLAQGAYHIKVVNKYNTSSCTFLVQ